MKKYDYLELLKLIRKCATVPNFRGGIFMSTLGMAHDAYKETIAIINTDKEEHEALYRIVQGQRQTAIEFKNGSAIWFVQAENNIRGITVHEGLYDENLTESFVKQYIAPLERRINT